MLRSRGALLDNPDYGAELLKFHQGRSLSIPGARILGPGRVEVDLVLEQSTESSYSFQLLVAANEGDTGGPRIVSEY